MSTTPKATDPVEVVPAVVDAGAVAHTNALDADGTAGSGGASGAPTAAQAAVLPTQLRHPWKATARSAVAFALGVAPLAPVIYHEATQHDPAQATGAAGLALALAGGITRVMATPTVEALLRRFPFTRWLAAAATPK